MTVGELAAALQKMPQDVSVMFSDSQHGESKVRSVQDTESYSGARIVLLSLNE